MAEKSRTGDAPPVGYPGWERSRDGRERQSPETGRWDPRQERWIPQQRGAEGDDYGIEPFPARSDPNRRPGQGRVLDYEEYTGTHSRRAELPAGRSVPKKRGRPVEEDDEDEEEPDQRWVYIGSFISTACWYLVPIAAYAGYALTLSSEPRAGCTNAFGLPCPAPRAEALTNLSNMVPELAVSMAISIVIAMFLGRVTTGWRPFAIGFASAVLGAGVATVAIAVLKTQM